MTGMLASVKDLGEARTVARAGADIIDMKAPEAGALGALDCSSVREIVATLAPEYTLSATVGDLPMDPKILVPAVRAMQQTGVDYVKIGLFPGGNWSASIESMKPFTEDGVRLIAVFFADRSPQINWFGNLASAGFTGVMLDTMDKTSGPLTRCYSPDRLHTFIHQARTYGFLCGLAGSLQSADIENLLPLAPDYLGFRGALCHRQQRTDRLDPYAVRMIRERIRLNPTIARRYSAK